jgi:hypothetical protein
MEEATIPTDERIEDFLYLFVSTEYEFDEESEYEEWDLDEEDEEVVIFIAFYSNNIDGY